MYEKCYIHLGTKIISWKTCFCIITIRLNCKLYHLSLIEIHFNSLTLLSFNWVLKVIDLFNFFFFVKIMLLLNMQLINDNFFKKKTLNKKSIIGIFVWVDVNALMYLMFSLFCFQKLVFNLKKKNPLSCFSNIKNTN